MGMWDRLYHIGRWQYLAHQRQLRQQQQNLPPGIIQVISSPAATPYGSGYTGPNTSYGSGFVPSNPGYVHPNPPGSGYVLPNPPGTGYVHPNPPGTGYVPPNPTGTAYVHPNPPGHPGYVNSGYH